MTRQLFILRKAAENAKLCKRVVDIIREAGGTNITTYYGVAIEFRLKTTISPLPNHVEHHFISGQIPKEALDLERLSYRAGKTVESWFRSEGLAPPKLPSDRRRQAELPEPQPHGFGHNG